MGGGLLQLVAYGAQDAYISGNPQITFWKGLFKRHTNFAMEPFRINFSGQVQWGTKQTALIGRHADLLYSTYVEVVLPKQTTTGVNYYWNNDVGALGYNLIKYVELDVGGQVIDRLYSEFMVLWSLITLPVDSRDKLNNMLSMNQSYGATTLPNDIGCAADGRQRKQNVLYIPLPFFFTRNPGAALPLIALQYHEVKINVLWNEPQLIAGNFTNATLGNQPPIQQLPSAIQAAIYIDYIYLDTEERRRMAQASHEYLIEQTQFNEDKGIKGANNRIDLTFNHPVKELIWVVQPTAYTDCRLAASIPSSDTISLSNYSTTFVSGTDGSDFKLTGRFNNGSWDTTPTINAPGSGYDTDSLLKITGYGWTLYIQVSTVGGSGNVLTFTYGTDTAGTNSQAPTAPSTRLQPFRYNIDPVFDQWLQINGQDRLDRRFGDYYNKVQGFQHHSGSDYGGIGIYSYSFALRPEEHQPSGTCNFSRIDTATIVMNMAGIDSPTFDFNNNNQTNDAYNDWDVRVYAINYNVLRIMSGMGGLAYSN